MSEFIKIERDAIECTLLMHIVKNSMHLLEQSTHASLQQEEIEDVQASSRKHQTEDSEIFDKCKNKLRLILRELDSFRDLLDNLQIVQADNSVQLE